MSTPTQVQPLPEVTGYSTDERLYATRYKQGGRTVYQIALSPRELTNLVVRPDPNKGVSHDNRKIRPRHALDFSKYILENENWVIPGIILRAPSIFDFVADRDVHTAQFGVISYGKAAGAQIQILDGQHRILGFHLAIENLSKKILEARDHLRRAQRTEEKGSRGIKDALTEIARLEAQLERLSQERVSVEIQVTDNPKEFRQMFYDIAENAIGITAAVKARFDQRKVVNRALSAVIDHPLLSERVDQDIDRVALNSPYLLSVKHVADLVRTANVGIEGRIGKIMEKTLDEAVVAECAYEFFDSLVASFPQFTLLMTGQMLPATLRQTTILGSPTFLRVLAGARYALLSDEHGFTEHMVEDFFKKLAPHMGAPVHENTIWRRQLPEVFDPNSYGPRGTRQHYVALMNALIAWALDKPGFLDAAPEPAPVVEVSEEEALDQLGIVFDVDTTALEVEVRNEIEEVAAESKARIAPRVKRAPAKKTT